MRASSRLWATGVALLAMSIIAGMQFDGGNRTAQIGPGGIGGMQFCGNGVREGLEECDDGNLVSNDGCSNTCQSEIFCCPEFGGGFWTTNDVCPEDCIPEMSSSSHSSFSGGGTMSSSSTSLQGSFPSISSNASRQFSGGPSMSSNSSAAGGWRSSLACPASSSVSARTRLPDPPPTCNFFTCGDTYRQAYEQCDPPNNDPPPANVRRQCADGVLALQPVDNWSRAGLYRLDIGTGKLTKITEYPATQDIHGLAIDREGRIISVKFPGTYSSNQDTASRLVRLHKDGTLDQLPDLTGGPLYSASHFAFGPDGKGYILDKNNDTLYRIDDYYRLVLLRDYPAAAMDVHGGDLAVNEYMELVYVNGDGKVWVVPLTNPLYPPYYAGQLPAAGDYRGMVYVDGTYHVTESTRNEIVRFRIGAGPMGTPLMGLQYIGTIKSADNIAAGDLAYCPPNGICGPAVGLPGSPLQCMNDMPLCTSDYDCGVDLRLQGFHEESIPANLEFTLKGLCVHGCCTASLGEMQEYARVPDHRCTCDVPGQPSGSYTCENDFHCSYIFTLNVSPLTGKAKCAENTFGDIRCEDGCCVPSGNPNEGRDCPVDDPLCADNKCDRGTCMCLAASGTTSSSAASQASLKSSMSSSSSRSSSSSSSRLSSSSAGTAGVCGNGIVEGQEECDEASVSFGQSSSRSSNQGFGPGNIGQNGGPPLGGFLIPFNAPGAIRFDPRDVLAQFLGSSSSRRTCAQGKQCNRQTCKCDPISSTSSTASVSSASSTSSVSSQSQASSGQSSSQTSIGSSASSIASSSRSAASSVQSSQSSALSASFGLSLNASQQSVSSQKQENASLESGRLASSAQQSSNSSPIACRSDADCPTGRCVNGSCHMCGNGTVDPGDVCDDGNAVDDDACSNRCKRGLLELCTAGAECESNLCRDGLCVPCVAHAECATGLCKEGRCIACASDGQCPSGLRCDQGSCVTRTEPLATILGRCGDGMINPGEACDLGNRNSNAPGALCRISCLFARCGDGIVDPPHEQCDDGNSAPGDWCDQVCAITGTPTPRGIAQVTQWYELPDGGVRADADTVAYGLPPYPPYAYPHASAQWPGGWPGALQPMHAPVGDTGPGAVAVMAAGAAGGLAWMRRRRKGL